MGRNAPEELKGRNVPEESDSLIQPPVKQLRRKSAKLWTVLVWLALWQGASMLFAQELLLPSPVTAFRRLAELLLTDTFRQSVVHSSGRILGGFTLGCFSGIACAIPAGMFPWFRELLTPPVTVIRAVPVASFVILSMVWLNARTLVVFIAFIMTFPPVYLGVCEGIAQTDQNLLEMARIFRVPFLRRVRGIYLPRILPYLRTAVSVSMGLCWKAGTAAEVIGLPRASLGERLYYAKVYFLTADLFAWTAVIIVLSACFERFFLWILDALNILCNKW